MTRKYMTNEEIRREGLKAVQDRLGAEGLIRFLQEFQPGSGDYTRDRYRWLPTGTLEEVGAEIKAFVASRKKAGKSGRSARSKAA